MEGDTAKAVRTQLRNQRLAPVLVEAAVDTSEIGQASALAKWLAPKAFTGAGLAVWTRQLAGLVAAGLPLERALTALLDEADEGPLSTW